MQSRRAAVITSVLAACSPAQANVAGAQDSPINKVLQLIGNLEAKIIKEGEQAQKVYAEFAEWCEDRARNVDFEIKTGKGEIADLKASIASAVANIEAANADIETVASSLTSNEADVKAATSIREKERADFEMEEKDLMDTISVIERAIGILERELRKGTPSMLQMKNSNDVVKALTVMVEASMLPEEDAKRLTALVQNNQQQEEQDDDDQVPGAPQAAAYQAKSGGIVDTLEDLLDKAKEQLNACRTKETNAKHNFEMLSQSLKDEIKFGKKDMDSAKKELAQNQQNKATAEGELQVTSKSLKEDEDDKSTLHQDCMESSADFEAATKSRGEELKALAAAKKAIQESTSGANSIQYDAVSFLQINGGGAGSMSSAADLANFEAVQLVRDLARKTRDPSLVLLAKRMSAVMRQGLASGQDPFAKVKTLIRDMIEKLMKDAGADATQKAYCDKEMGETTAKLTDRTAAVDKLSTQIDSMQAKTVQLKEEVAELQKGVAEIISSQASMDKIRAEEHETYVANKADMEQGLTGVKTALTVLREYYAQEGAAHKTSEGAANGVIGLLEVVESDFTKSLAEMKIEENTAKNEYQRLTQKGEVSKAVKEQGIKYKTKESKNLEARLAESRSDLETTHEELVAVQEYDKKIKQICIAKPETYAERDARRQAEIAGLKQALQILRGEAVLLQGRKVLRGIRTHA